MHDNKVLPQLLNGQETSEWGDAEYVGQSQVIEQHSSWAQDLTQQREINRKLSKVRALVEHAIAVIKRNFGFAKVH